MTSTLTSPGAATRARAEMEEVYLWATEVLMGHFAAEVRRLAYAALEAPTLLAAGADPFAYTNVRAAWYTAVRTMTESVWGPGWAPKGSEPPVTQIDVEALATELQQANFPDDLFSETRDMLIQSRDQKWGAWRTKRELSKLLIPKEGDDGHAAYKNRVRRMARTAATRNFNSRQLKDLALLGYSHKKWVARMDALTRPDHFEANGEVVALSEPFIVGGEAMMHPGDSHGSHAQTANCRCTLIGHGEPGPGGDPPISPDETLALRNALEVDPELVYDRRYEEGLLALQEREAWRKKSAAHEDLAQVVEAWTGPGQNMQGIRNEIARGGHTLALETIRTTPIPKGVTLYRGTGGVSRDKVAFFASVKPGDSIEMRGIGSFTERRDWAEGFGSANTESHMLIKVTDGYGVPIARISNTPHEKEWLLTGKLKVTNVKRTAKPAPSWQAWDTDYEVEVEAVWTR